MSLTSYFHAYLRFKFIEALDRKDGIKKTEHTSVDWSKKKIIHLIDELAYYDSISYVTCGQTYPLRAGIPREFIEDTSPISEVLSKQNAG